jgi:hypothetical protein
MTTGKTTETPINDLADRWLAEPSYENRKALWDALSRVHPLAGPWLYRGFRFQAIPEHDDYPHGYQFAIKMT